MNILYYFISKSIYIYISHESQICIYCKILRKKKHQNCQFPFCVTAIIRANLIFLTLDIRAIFIPDHAVVSKFIHNI